MGFAFVASGPLVRSSYKAAEVFVRSILRPGDPEGADRLIKERLAEAQRAAQAIDGDAHGAPRTTSELAARATASLIPASSLLRRAP
jgi:lipoic acid synthetase